ncbi:hypothetical protein MalM25_33210 [Planctomycetes bacterium MalM25]|nr:hypothetical protein MalM25_33210 [Planctomycetes bacterium MalM25]
MPATLEGISKLLMKDDINYYYVASEQHFLVPFHDGPNIYIKLLDDGEALLMSSDPLSDLRELSGAERMASLTRLMELNDQITLGRYVGSDTVRAEVAIGLTKSKLTRGQFRQHFSALMSLVRVALSHFPSTTLAQADLAPELTAALEKLKSRFDPSDN